MKENNPLLKYLEKRKATEPEKPLAAAAEKLKVELWNRSCPPGTKVRLYSSRKQPREPLLETVTISHAELLGGHTAVVWLQDCAGCISVDAIEALAE